MVSRRHKVADRASNARVVPDTRFNDPLNLRIAGTPIKTLEDLSTGPLDPLLTVREQTNTASLQRETVTKKRYSCLLGSCRFMFSTRRTIRAVEHGNNSFGRTGTLRCRQCRKWKRKAIFSNSCELTVSVSTKHPTIHATAAWHIDYLVA